ncbi:MAG: DUF6438 domain-containing protein [Candidatus Desulfofervidaceae bacterium]|nr:DUF6438 domain-containing protein [Candidatus Desulfofervidaceae bacterium]
MNEVHPFDYITLERTSCFGCCPVYKIKVYNSGLVEWEGIDFVARKGKDRWHIAPEKAKKAAEIAEKIIVLLEEHERLIKVGEKELRIVTDCSSCEVAIKYKNGRVKSVEHYHGDMGAPKELERLENEIDRVVGTEEWVGN